jgi:hypothetical protein
MPAFVDITGLRFGKLVVIRKITNKGKIRWLCRCDCGNETTPRSWSLNSKKTASCGCTGLRHGETASGKMTREYRCWSHMLNRCNNPNDAGYVNYGGRGIQVRWPAFEDFLTYILATIGRCPPGFSIDRIDNDGHYEPGNVQWATRSMQNGNRRPFTEETKRKISASTKQRPRNKRGQLLSY